MINDPIRTLGNDPVLRKIAEPLPRTYPVAGLLIEMRGAMVKHDGIGIAAPQIGVPLRVFLVAKELFPAEVRAKLPSDAFLNPKTVRKSFKQQRGEEGCLSVPGVFGEVKRGVRITVEAYDAQWKKFRISAEGLLARVLQHELDHLEGMLFIDRAKRETLHEVLPSGEIKPWKAPDIL